MVDFSNMSVDELQRNIDLASSQPDDRPQAKPDFASMSVPELQSHIKSLGSQPASQPDFSGMSVDELQSHINRLKSQPDQAPPMMPTRPAGISSGRPQLSGNIGAVTNAAPSDIDRSLDRRAAPSYSSALSPKFDEVMQRPIVRPSIARSAVQSVGDFVSPPMELAAKFGLDLPAARAAAAESAQGNRAIGPDLAGIGSGVLNFTDSVMGFAPGLLKQMGVPGYQNATVNDQEAFNNLPLVKEMRDRAPHQFDQLSSITPMVAPQPGMARLIPEQVMARNAQYLPVMVDSLGRQIANTALNSGGINSLLYSADKFKKGDNVDPLGAAVAFGTGAAGGALIHGGIAAPGMLKGIASDVVKAFSKLTPNQQRIATEAAAANRPSVEQFTRNIGAQNLPDETKAMIDATRQAPQAMSPTPPLTASTAPKVNMLQGKVETQPPLKVAPASGRQVTVNGEQVHLDGDVLRKYEAAEADYKSRLASIKDYQQRGLMFSDEAGKSSKAAGMQFSAEARRITGKLTGREMLKAAEDAAKIRKGDWVSIQGKPAKVLKNPAYGRVHIDVNGTQMHADYYDLTKIDAPKVPDAVHYSDNAPPIARITDEQQISDRAVMERKEFPLSAKFFDEQGYGEGWTPNQLSDEELQRHLDLLNYNAKYDSAQRGDPTKIRALVQEKMRREQRRIGGYPEDWKVPEKMDLSGYTEEQIMHMIDTGSEQMQNEAAMELLARHPEAMQPADRSGRPPLEIKIEDTVNSATPAANIEKWAQDLTGHPVDLSQPVEGDFRRTIKPTEHGRNKNKLAEPLAGHAVYDTPDMQHHVAQFATAKVNKDYNEAVLNKFRRDAWTKFADQDAKEFKFPNGAKITKLQGKRSLTAEAQNELDTVRDTMATALAPTKSPVIELLMTQKFGKGAHDAHVQYERVPDNRTEAGELYKDIYDRAKDAERAYDNLKPSTIRAEVAKAEASLKPDPEKIAHLHELMVERSQVEELFTSMEAKIQKQKNDITAPMHVSTTVPHPLGEQFPDVEVGVMYKKGAMEKVIPQEMEQAWQEAKAVIEGRDANRQPTVQFGSNMRSVKSAALAAITGVFSTIKAEAANTATKAAPHVDSMQQMLHAWNSLPFNEVTGGAILLHAIAPTIARNIMKEDGKLFKAAFFWNDTMDHFHHGELIAKRMPPKSQQLSLLKPVPQRPLEAEFWNVSGQVQQATLGVSFDETLKQQAMNELRRGDVTPLEMINGTKGAAANMTPEQRNALAMWKIGQDHLKSLVEERIQVLKEYQAANPMPESQGVSKLLAEKTGLIHFRDPVKATIQAHEYVRDSFDGANASASRTDIDHFLSGLINNWMDGLFFMNPDFHGTNLSDMFIVAAPAVGARNVWKANQLLIGDAEVRALMHESNLAGGLKVDRTQVAIKAGKQKASWSDKDIQSDLYNANATWIAGAMKYAQARKSELAQIGFSGSDTQFVKDVLKGKIDPTITMDLFATNARVLSRTMGSDPYNVNTNFLGRSGMAKTLAIFCRQPARVSRLAMHYLATGNFVALYTMLGYTMAIGGRSAIPEDLQTLYGLTNADSAYKAASTADALDIYTRASGNKLTPKITWSILWPAAAGSNPLSDTKKTVGKGIVALSKLDGKGVFGAASSFTPAFVPRLKGVPVGESMRIVEAVMESVKGQYSLNATALGVAPLGNQDMRLDTPYDKVRHILEPLLPGKDTAQDAYNQSMNEKNSRSTDLLSKIGLGQQPDEQYYTRDGGKLLQHGYMKYDDPLSSLFGGAYGRR